MAENVENNFMLSSLCVVMSTTQEWIKIYLNVEHNVLSLWIIYEFVFRH